MLLGIGQFYVLKLISVIPQSAAPSSDQNLFFFIKNFCIQNL